MRILGRKEYIEMIDSSVRYICKECTIKKGGIWRWDSITVDSFHCEFCRDFTYLCNIYDCSIPGIEEPKGWEGMRD